MIEQKCLIFGTPASVLYDGMKGVYRVTSDRAGGEYIVSQEVIEDNEIKDDMKTKLARWIFEQNEIGNVPRIISNPIDEISKRPKLSVAQRANALFKFIAKKHVKIGEKIRWMSTGYVTQSFPLEALAATESEFDTSQSTWTCPEVEYLFEYLRFDGRLEAINDSTYQITPRGYNFLEGFSDVNTIQTFVAMWFNKEVEEAYNLGIAPAIRDAGFDPVRIDRVEHNNKIDDEIVAEIRKSKFLIADFTSGFITDANVSDEGVKREKLLARGGVYYEAGFAQGLGLPVIWTCRKDCIDDVHFDTRQYNHIVWETPEELYAKLKHRIEATIT